MGLIARARVPNVVLVQPSKPEGAEANNVLRAVLSATDRHYAEPFDDAQSFTAYTVQPAAPGTKEDRPPGTAYYVRPDGTAAGPVRLVQMVNSEPINAPLRKLEIEANFDVSTTAGLDPDQVVIVGGGLGTTFGDIAQSFIRPNDVNYISYSAGMFRFPPEFFGPFNFTFTAQLGHNSGSVIIFSMTLERSVAGGAWAHWANLVTGEIRGVGPATGVHYETPKKDHVANSRYRLLFTRIGNPAGTVTVEMIGPKLSAWVEIEKP